MWDFIADVIGALFADSSTVGVSRAGCLVATGAAGVVAVLLLTRHEPQFALLILGAVALAWVVAIALDPFG